MSDSVAERTNPAQNQAPQTPGLPHATGHGLSRSPPPSPYAWQSVPGPGFHAIDAFATNPHSLSLPPSHWVFRQDLWRVRASRVELLSAVCTLKAEIVFPLGPPHRQLAHRACSRRVRQPPLLLPSSCTDTDLLQAEAETSRQ